MSLALLLLLGQDASMPLRRPFLDPMDLHGAIWLGGWTLLVPLALGIAIIYKAVRVPEAEHRPEGKGWWSVYCRQTFILAVQIIASMIALAAAAYLFVEVYVRWIQDRAP